MLPDFNILPENLSLASSARFLKTVPNLPCSTRKKYYTADAASSGKQTYVLSRENTGGTANEPGFDNAGKKTQVGNYRNTFPTLLRGATVNKTKYCS